MAPNGTSTLRCESIRTARCDWRLRRADRRSAVPTRSRPAIRCASFGTGAGDIDRVKIRIDDPATTLPGPPADVGAGDFTLEVWLNGERRREHGAAVACGANTAWTDGNVVVDRDRQGADRKFGLSIAGGKVVFGVVGRRDRQPARSAACRRCSTARGTTSPSQRRRSDGFLWLFVDGNLEAQARRARRRHLVSRRGGTRKRRTIRSSSSARRSTTRASPRSGWLDELRISTKLRYAANFPRPRAPFVVDRFTAALYHFDDGSGATLYDVAGATGGPSNGLIKRGGAANGPAWMPDSPFNVGGLVSNGTIAF